MVLEIFNMIQLSKMGMFAIFEISMTNLVIMFIPVENIIGEELHFANLWSYFPFIHTGLLKQWILPINIYFYNKLIVCNNTGCNHFEV